MKNKFLVSFIVMVILLTACAPSAATQSVSATSAPASSGNTVTISGFAFDPATITIKVGGTVTWTNQDSVVHTVVADDKSWSSDNMAKGASYSHTFDTAGTFTYICGVHPSMQGTVIVQP
jgi:plastocyanin